MAQQPQIRLHFVRARLAPVFKVVEDVHFTADSLRGYYLVRLGHLSCFIDFPLVIDLDFDLNSLLLGLLVGWAHHIGYTWRIDIIETRVVLSCVLWWLEWYFDFYYLDVVLLVVWGVSANEQSLHWEITAVGAKFNQISWLRQLTCPWSASIPLWARAMSTHVSKGCHTERVHAFSRSYILQRFSALQFHPHCRLNK